MGSDIQRALELLGVGPSASHEEIRRAFRARSKTCHPDKVAHLDPVRAPSQVEFAMDHALLRQVDHEAQALELLLLPARVTEHQLHPAVSGERVVERETADRGSVERTLQREVDLVIDGGYCGMEPTTVVDLADEAPLVLRVGKGDIAPFEN